MPHAKDCSAMVPCDACSQVIRNAQDARHEYNRALEILDELGAMPWIVKDASRGDTTADFWRVYEALRELRNDADRLIPQYDY